MKKYKFTRDQLLEMFQSYRKMTADGCKDTHKVDSYFLGVVNAMDWAIEKMEEKL